MTDEAKKPAAKPQKLTPAERSRRLLSTASPRLQRMLQGPSNPPSPVSEEQTNASVVLSQTSDRLRAAMRPADPEEPVTPDDPRAPQYCMVECPEGEHPVLRVFTDKLSLAAHMKGIDGTDTFCWPFYGVPLSFTCGPVRVLMCPDDTAIQLTPKVKENPDIDETDLPLQTDGFMGPPVLLTAPVASVLKTPDDGGRVNAKPRKRPPRDDSDDFDDRSRV